MATEAETAEIYRQLRLVERVLQLSTNMFCTIMACADDCPDEVLEAADDWFAYLSEVAEDV